MVGAKTSNRNIEGNKLFQERPDDVELPSQGISASKEIQYDLPLRSWLARLPDLDRSPGEVTERGLPLPSTRLCREVVCLRPSETGPQ